MIIGISDDLVGNLGYRIMRTSSPFYPMSSRDLLLVPYLFDPARVLSPFFFHLVLI